MADPQPDFPTRNFVGYVHIAPQNILPDRMAARQQSWIKSSLKRLPDLFTFGNIANRGGDAGKRILIAGLGTTARNG